MKISDILNKSSIIADLESTNKNGVIKELARSVSKATDASPDDIATVLMEREMLGSTGIGGGIAIPHGKLNSVKSVTIGFGLSREGVEYDSLDNRLVHIFFLVCESFITHKAGCLFSFYLIMEMRRCERI